MHNPQRIVLEMGDSHQHIVQFHYSFWICCIYIQLQQKDIELNLNYYYGDSLFLQGL